MHLPLCLCPNACRLVVPVALCLCPGARILHTCLCPSACILVPLEACAMPASLSAIPGARLDAPLCQVLCSLLKMGTSALDLSGLG